MSLRTFGAIGHIVVDILLIPFVIGTGLLVLFTGALSMSADALIMGLVFLAAVVFLVVDIIVTLVLGIAPPGSRRAGLYQWYSAGFAGLFVLGIGLGAGLNAAVALLCAAGVVAGFYLRQRLLHAPLR